MKRIRKVQVSTGVYWVEVPDANAYVLCGAPADSTKHLFKRGLIVPTENDGVSFETGPNIILLSDLMLQNGMFCNMVEFPILQMLYRQGMLIPGHPNNTGQKPLLVGSPDQIEAQLQYIYRGNYGLVSTEELMDAGMAPSMADELMEMKLKFAFGKIHDTLNFLETCPLGAARVEIRPGLGLRRVRANVFEFDYDEESVTIDLNLGNHEKYSSPIPLDFHNIQKEYFAVIHSGEGDGWDTDRSAMMSILMFQGKVYLIDAGPSVIQILEALGISVNEVEGIFHTHSHDDHFAGLPALMRTDRRLKYFATPMVRASVAKKMCALLSMDESDLEYYFDIESLQHDTWNDIDGLEVKPIISPHPVETTIFQFRTLWEDGYKVYAHYADIAAFSVIDGMVKRNADEAGISPEFAERVKRSYLEPVDVKKIDIGGGMIHGAAKDFRADSSKKIVLAHTALALSDEQKEIGSQAAFGTVDVLIPSFQDYGLKAAFDYLQADFSDVPSSQFRMLLNHPAPTLNPGTIVVREGEVCDYTYLILSGFVEMIRSSRQVKRQLFAGSMIGEVSALRERPSEFTFRTLSYVRALKVPARLYRDFIRINNLYSQVERLHEAWNFLIESWLFGDGIPDTVLNLLVQNIDLQEHPWGHEFDLKSDRSLRMLKSGKVELYKGEQCLEHLQPGDFFGEEWIVGGWDSDRRVRVASDSAEVYAIRSEKLEYIPICRWKLREIGARRRV